MSEEQGTVKKAGWSCFGCGLGLIFSVFLVCGLIILGLIALGSMVPGDSGRSSSSPDDPEGLDEEYVMGKHDENLPKIAVINVRGVIVSDEDTFDSNLAHSRQICLRIRRAASDPDVKALIINLNTPGGEVVASDEIYAEILRFRKTGKPAVAMMNTMAASGGYYVAAACNPIIANKLTLTGSIGVIMSTINYRGLFEKIGLQAEVYTSGKMKDMLNGARQRTPEEIRIVQQLVNNTYNEFTRIVAESRKIPLEKIRSTEIGDGRIFDGVQAKDLGLVDSLGYFRDAVDAAAKKANLKPDSYTVIRYKESFSFARLFSILTARSGLKGINVQLNGTPSASVFTPQPGKLYYLPAQY